MSSVAKRIHDISSKNDNKKNQNKKKWFSLTISKNCVLYIQDPKQDLVAHECLHLWNLSLQ